MKCLKRNRQTVYYSLYRDKSYATDSNGYKTGELIRTYTTPKKARMNISPARGTADVEQFGINSPYTHTLVTDDMTTPFDTDTIFWIGKTPINNTPYNYVVVQVARSLNSVTIAVKEVDVNV